MLLVLARRSVSGGLHADAMLTRHHVRASETHCSVHVPGGTRLTHRAPPSALLPTMATPGADGVGLRSVEELLVFLRRRPLSFYDQPFMASYTHFLKPEHEELLLAIFDSEGSSAATLRLVAARSSHIELPLPVFHQLVRQRLRMLCNTTGVPVDDTSGHMQILVLFSRDAAEAGQTYILCPLCTVKEKPASPLTLCAGKLQCSCATRSLASGGSAQT